MPFSRLLLLAASSKKEIRGSGSDRVHISPKISVAGRDAYEGEVILCFHLDHPADRERQVARSLGIVAADKRCDGLVFYSDDQKEERVICLVEMKSTNVIGAAEQLVETREHIEKLLDEECDLLSESGRSHYGRQIRHILWKAGLYHHGASPDQTRDIDKKLKQGGFSGVSILDKDHRDLRPLLTGEKENAKEMARKYKSGKKR